MANPMTDSHANQGANPAWETEESGQQFPLLDYLQLLWFRRKLIIAITLFVAAVGFIQVNEIKNVYTASSTMIVGLPEDQVVDIESVLGRKANANDVIGEIEVLQSRSLAAKVIERLNLVNHPEFNPGLREPEESLFDFLKYLNPRKWVPDSWKQSIKEALGRETERAVAPLSPLEQEENQQRRLVSTATNILLGKLNIQRVEYSSVLMIRVSSLDPKMAARIANEFPEAYIVDQLEARFEATEKANAWLTEQLQELEAKVVESERAVEIYRDEYGLAESRGMSILDAQLSELNSQLIIARAEKAEVEARLEQMNRLLTSGGQGIETASEVLSSTLIQQLRTQEAQALSRASELSVEYGPKHPRMLQVQAELVEIHGRIREEVGLIAAAMENEAEFVRTRVASLESSLRAAQG